MSQDKLNDKPEQWLEKSLSGSFSGAHNFDVTEKEGTPVTIPDNNKDSGNHSGFLLESVGNQFSTLTYCPSIIHCITAIDIK